MFYFKSASHAKRLHDEFVHNCLCVYNNKVFMGCSTENIFLCSDFDVIPSHDFLLDHFRFTHLMPIFDNVFYAKDFCMPVILLFYGYGLSDFNNLDIKTIHVPEYALVFSKTSYTTETYDRLIPGDYKVIIDDTDGSTGKIRFEAVMAVGDIGFGTPDSDEDDTFYSYDEDEYKEVEPRLHLNTYNYKWPLNSKYFFIKYTGTLYLYFHDICAEWHRYHLRPLYQSLTLSQLETFQVICYDIPEYFMCSLLVTFIKNGKEPTDYLKELVLYMPVYLYPRFLKKLCDIIIDICWRYSSESRIAYTGQPKFLTNLTIYLYLPSDSFAYLEASDFEDFIPKEMYKASYLMEKNLRKEHPDLPSYCKPSCKLPEYTPLSPFYRSPVANSPVWTQENFIKLIENTGKFVLPVKYKHTRNKTLFHATILDRYSFRIGKV